MYLKLPKYIFPKFGLCYLLLAVTAAVPRSTQPSTLRGTVNEYQPHG